MPYLKPAAPILNSGNSITANLLLYLPLYEGTGTLAHDLSGNAHDGTMTNCTWSTDGNGDPVVHFDGTAKIDCGTHADMEAKTAWTAFVRFNLDANNSTVYTLIAKSSSSSGPWDLRKTSNTVLRLLVDWTTNDILTSPTVSGMFGAYHSLFAQIASGTGSVFLDSSTAAGSDAGTGTINTSSSTFKVGDRVADQLLVGTIHSVALWSRALSAAEIDALIANPNLMLASVQSGVGDTKRQVVAVQESVGDLYRQVVATEDSVGDLLRQVVAEESGVGDTKRQVVAVQTDVGDLYRSIAEDQSGVGDTLRQIVAVQADVGDLYRQVIATEDGVGDLLRQVIATEDGVGDTYRQVVAVQSSVGDLLRTIAEGQTSVGDLVRQVGLSFAVPHDTRRDVAGSHRRHVQPNTTGEESIEHGDLLWVRSFRDGQVTSRRMTEFSVQNEIEAVPVRLKKTVLLIGPETPVGWRRRRILPDGTTEIVTIGNSQSGRGDLLRQVVATQSGVGDLMRTIEEIQAGVGDLKRQVSETQSSAGDLLRQIVAVQTQVGDLLRAISEDQSGVGDTYRSIVTDTVQGGVGDLLRQVAEVQAQVGDLLRTIGQDQSGVGDLYRQRSAVEADVGDLKRIIAESQSGVGDTLRIRAQQEQGVGDTLRQVSSATGFRTWNFTTHAGLAYTITAPWKGPYTFAPAAGSITRYVATDGLDAPGRGTLIAPYLTINYAIAQANAGDLIYIRAGTYSGNDAGGADNATGPCLFINKSGTAAAPIIISAYPGEEHQAILTLANPTDDDTEVHVVKLRSCNHVWLHGLTIVGTRWTGTNTGSVSTNQSGIAFHAPGGGAGVNCRIYNCIIKDCWHTGIKTQSSSEHDFLVEANLFYDIGTGITRDHGIYVSTNSVTTNADCVIRGNVATNIRAYGFHYAEGGPGYPQNVIDYDNIALDCGYMGGNAAGFILGCHESRVSYGVTVKNPRGGIRLFRSACHNNIVHGMIDVANLQHQVGIDSAGGTTNVPYGNSIQHCVIYPSTGPTWYEDSPVVPEPIPAQTSSASFTNPTFVTYDTTNRIYDLRLPSGSPYEGTIPQLTGMNGLLNNAPTTPGIFSGALWLEPTFS